MWDPELALWSSPSKQTRLKRRWPPMPLWMGKKPPHLCCSSPPQFIIEDMKQQQTNKHSNLHREDQHITVEELWRGWKTSEGAHPPPKDLARPTRVESVVIRACFVSLPRLRPVHNWTMEDTVQWLKDSVELPQYEKNFRDFRVTGNTLPRSVPASITPKRDVCCGLFSGY